MWFSVVFSDRMKLIVCTIYGNPKFSAVVDTFEMNVHCNHVFQHLKDCLFVFFVCFQKWLRVNLVFSLKESDTLLKVRKSSILVFTQCLDTSCVVQTRKVLDKNICATFVGCSWRMPYKLVVAISIAKNA